MKFESITFNNFKPYYGQQTIDLTVENGKNIVLIGGRNGQGKTSFLVGVVWCLYGTYISSVDEVFKEEVKGNYNLFLDRCLNTTAKERKDYIFSVEAKFSHVELWEGKQVSTVSIKRIYNYDTKKEILDIKIDDEYNHLLSDDEEKINFINDYLIPIEIAKFVFFDAEKIADIAQLGAKEQASTIDEVFSQVLGLNTYRKLLDDIIQYERELKKIELPESVNAKIRTFENEKERLELKQESIVSELSEIENRVYELRNNIKNYYSQLISRGDASIKYNIEELNTNEESLKKKFNQVKQNLNENSYLIPFSIVAFKMEEAHEHLTKEQQVNEAESAQKVLKEKTKEFAELLFNKPPYPENHDLDMEQKQFYYNKAKHIISSIYQQEEYGHDEVMLDFVHDLDKSDVKHFNNIFDLVKSQGRGTYENLFNEYMRTKNDYEEALKKLRLAETESKDDYVLELKDKKAVAEKEKDKLEQKTGELKNELENLKKAKSQCEQKITSLYNMMEGSKESKNKYDLTQKYINTLRKYITEEKENKKNALENKLREELNNLFHKKGWFHKVTINLLDDFGLVVKLYNNKGNEINPSDLSKGEQQLYISALLKVILEESVYDLPILIDTPLGRLDQAHRNNILEHYYPYLSEQVIIFSTNTEIRANDVDLIENFVSKRYLLENDNYKTVVKKGYFN